MKKDKKSVGIKLKTGIKAGKDAAQQIQDDYVNAVKSLLAGD